MYSVHGLNCALRGTNKLDWSTCCCDLANVSAFRKGTKVILEVWQSAMMESTAVSDEFMKLGVYNRSMVAVHIYEKRKIQMYIYTTVHAPTKCCS